MKADLPATTACPRRDVPSSRRCISAAWLSGNTPSIGTFSQPSADAGQHMVDARLPFGRGLVDMAEMQAGESLRSGQDALADVLEGLAFGLADADHMAELLHHVESAVEHGGAVGIDGEIDAFAVR